MAVRDETGWEPSAWPVQGGPADSYGVPEYYILDTPSGPITVCRISPTSPGLGEESFLTATGQAPPTANPAQPPDWGITASLQAAARVPVQTVPMAAPDWGAGAFLAAGGQGGLSPTRTPGPAPETPARPGPPPPPPPSSPPTPPMGVMGVGRQTVPRRPRSRPGRGPAAGERRSAERYRSYLDSERESATLYRELAATSDDQQRPVLRELADVEDQHAAHWEEQLRLLGERFPAARRRQRNPRVRFLIWLARRTSLSTVLPMLERSERSNAGMYDAEQAAAPGMRLDERLHAELLAGMSLRRVSRGGIGDGESWHRSDGSGALRAAVFGVNDGLVSNAALVLGFVGSGASSRAILLAGVAGLLAGAFSMGAGEFVSVSSQREMFEAQIRLEEEELEAFPEGEERELALLYQAKGLAKERAEETAHSIMQDKKVALDTLAREELGLDPDDLGSPWATAASSALSFTAGAFIVVLPFLIGKGVGAAVVAVMLAAIALGAVGGTLSFLSGNSPRRGAVRQLIVGGLAVSAAFFIGMMLGVNVN